MERGDRISTKGGEGLSILGNDKDLGSALGKVAFALQTLQQIETAITWAAANHPSRDEMEILAEADGLLGRAAHDIAQAGIVLRQLEKRRINQ